MINQHSRAFSCSSGFVIGLLRDALETQAMAVPFSQSNADLVMRR